MSTINQKKHRVINDIDPDIVVDRSSRSSSARNIQKPLSERRKQLIRNEIEEEIDQLVNTCPESLYEARRYVKVMGKLDSKYHQKYPTAEGDYRFEIIMMHCRAAENGLKHLIKEEARAQKQHEREEEELRRGECEAEKRALRREECDSEDD